jgi:hypothetical protein
MSAPRTRSAPSHTRCAPSPNQTPACRGLVTFKFAGSGQARSRLGEGWGGGWCGDAPTLPHTTTPTPNPSPQGGGECTEFAEVGNAPSLQRRKKAASRVGKAKRAHASIVMPIKTRLGTARRRAFAHPTLARCQRRLLGLLPPPLWGRVGEGGGAVMHRRCLTQRPPPLTPPHKGEGNALSLRRGNAPSLQRRKSSAAKLNPPGGRLRRRARCCARAPA